jgi:hypothetical protein
VNKISGFGRQPALARQITNLEEQLVRRRQSVRQQVAGIRQKVAGNLITPGVLITAVGIGVTLEQSQNQKFWSVAALLNALNASLGLLQSFKSPATDSY